MELLKLFIQSTFIDNMVFSFFFGMCSYIAVSKSVKTANGLGLAVTFVMLMTVPLNYLLEKYILKAGALAWINPDFAMDGATPVDLSFLSFILFIAVIAAFVQLLEMVVEKFSPSLYNSLGIFLPLIAVNCAIMGGALFMQQRNFATVGEAAVFGFGSGFGWWIAILVMAAIRERLSYSNVPKGLRGPGLAFIITGLLGMAFMIFSGFQM